MKDYFKRQIEYLKDNPQNLWFKRKLYGWGWTPVRWQGWAVIVIYIIVLAKIVWLSEFYAADPITTRIIPIIILTALLLYICYKKGESPRWQWGLPRDKSE